jgi:hypothetical protein
VKRAILFFALIAAGLLAPALSVPAAAEAAGDDPFLWLE